MVIVVNNNKVQIIISLCFWLARAITTVEAQRFDSPCRTDAQAQALKELAGEDACGHGYWGILVILAVGLVLFIVAMIVFMPLHYWVCVCCGCSRFFVKEITLNQEPTQQYRSRAQSLEEQWNTRGMNGSSKEAQTPSGTYSLEGSSRLTFVNGLCFKTPVTLELTFNSEDGTVSGTKKFPGGRATIAIEGRWCDHQVVWLESNGPAKKIVASGTIALSSKNNSCTISGDFYNFESDFGKFCYKGTASKTPPITQP